jgi:methylase of polypeptide subunit release factors
VTEVLRARLADAGYTTERLEESLGGGRISFSAADVAVHERRLPPGEPFSVLVRLFLLGASFDAGEAQRALGSVDVGTLVDTGWLEETDGGVRATLKLVPHGELLIASDRETEGPTRADWVAGIHPPSVTLAKLTVRLPVARALDVATGNGIQALLASHHAGAVVATDVNPRALALAALNARLNGVSNIELREGSYFEPAGGERFDLVTCNPPYVISPESSYAYRDSGLPGDTVSRQVVEAAPDVLNEGGFAHILISWAHAADDRWSTLEDWIVARNCDAWLLHLGSDDPVTHASGWLKPLAAEHERYEETLDRWLDYLRAGGIGAVAYGAVVLRRRAGGRPWLRTDSVGLERQGAGLHVARVFEAQDLLERLPDERALLAERPALVAEHELRQSLAVSAGRLEVRRVALQLTHGLAFEVGLDEQTLLVLPHLDGTRTLGEALAERAAELGLTGGDAESYADAALPPVRRLLELGFLEVGR